ncbi:MAG TPA: polyphosphate kinase 1 [Chitinophagaceae bacterium]|nr:polyphosphate kinase 1 [Chitinophagaceae bacterium]
MHTQFLSRDLSWLSFNGRVLEEAGRITVPLMERFRFLSIFSSNLDEFYRVRMPSMLLLHEIEPSADPENAGLLKHARTMIQQQQQTFGMILRTQLIPALCQYNINLIYNQVLPAAIEPQLKAYFQAEIMTFLQIIQLSGKNDSFFPKSNALYLAVICENGGKPEKIFIISIPSGKLPRFFSVVHNSIQYIVFLDDIIKRYLPLLFTRYKIKGAWNIKITRDAELDLADEYEGDLAAKIEKQLAKRDDGNATRFLCEPGMDEQQLEWLTTKLNLSKENMVEGGSYHNLKDLSSIPVKNESLNYPVLPPVQTSLGNDDSIFMNMLQKDSIIHTPYQSYNPVLRFFNEAATDASVKEIYVTLYRVAGDSRIVNALITAASNGKKVTVFIELKARFDEENNIRWSKKMKAAGILIINSIPALKVHAKVALVKKKSGDRFQYFGLLATGNLNELTARFYTDHILFTTHSGIVMELELLFLFLTRRRKPAGKKEIRFKQLLVAQFNLQDRFLKMIDNEINYAKQGKPAAIIIKLNNLEEKTLISKLYEASQAGVIIQMIVRSTCCLNPGIPAMSENITVTRIVDRYLEHGRVFVFHNAGNEQLFLGSADWMNRNVHRRIEVCFPVYDETIKHEIMEIINLQLKDNTQAVTINAALDNTPVPQTGVPIQSQPAIYNLLNQHQTLQL